MEANVTLKLTPREFDLLRDSVRTNITELGQASEDTRVTPETRRRAKTLIVQLTDLLSKME
jgi:hypothetical protein